MRMPPLLASSFERLEASRVCLVAADCDRVGLYVSRTGRMNKGVPCQNNLNKPDVNLASNTLSDLRAHRLLSCWNSFH